MNTWHFLTMLPSSSPSSPSWWGSSRWSWCSSRPGEVLPLQSWCSETDVLVLCILLVRYREGTCRVSWRSKDPFVSSDSMRRGKEPLKLPARLECSSSELSPSSELSLPSPDRRDLRSLLCPRRLRLGARPMLFQLERRLFQELPARQGLCGELRALGCGKDSDRERVRSVPPAPGRLDGQTAPR